MTAIATVVVSLDPEAIYALVNDAQHVAFLQQECRIYGSSEGAMATASAASRRLRLALEEMAVGVTKGFLRLEAPTRGVDGSGSIQEDGQALVEKITQELAGNKEHRMSNDGVTWRLSPQRRDRLRVFQDLWERGYIVTFGSKFGADFLIYKDNPKHAHAVALIVVKGYEEEFARVDVVSFCRVAKMVRKQFMFACVGANVENNSEDEQKISSKDSGAAQVGTDSVVYVSLTHALLVSRQEESSDLA